MTSTDFTTDSGSSTDSVKIHTLGRFQVLVDGAPIRFQTRAHSKPLELLKVLIALGGDNVPETLLA